MIAIFSTDERGGFAGNLVYAVVAQGIGLLSSVLTSLVLPKILCVEDYAYWQLFTMYSSYSGFALFGINDGIYLRLGGRRYSDLDYGELKAQQLAVVVSQILVALACLAAISIAAFEPYRALVLVLCVVSGFIANVTMCLRYVFQCTNLTRISSVADVLAKGLFLVFIGTTLLLGAKSSLPFIVGYVVCQALAFLYIVICARSIVFAKADFRRTIATCFADVRAGLKITVAYYADSFIVGFTRMLTDWRLGLAAFGKLSLSFSLTNFVLGFIGQVSMVAFPMLKRLDTQGQREKYLDIRLALHTVLPCAYLLYVPARVVLGLWLPEYNESFIYLALTMPLCVYSCKANLLFTTYLKMERREGVLCLVNVAAMVLNGAFTALSIVGLTSVEMATCGIVLTVMLRDLTFELLMSRRFGCPVAKSCLAEALVTVGFMVASWFLGVWSWPVVVALLVVYLWLDCDGVRLVVSQVRSRLSC